MIVIYDWELEKYLDERNAILSHHEYIHILKTCPQIDHIRFNAFENKFEFWSVDGGYFSTKVYYDKGKEDQN